ncbi:PseG/SpsG family protein [Spirillospora sp. NPDC048911]|uniref:PseG/SpsG family protein n=1 Tax=Spirillospora sp. NPDC048911 TaxID=3364527 RepID=UPI003717D910
MRVGIRCDARPRIGAGHLIRCVALAEELVRRGTEVVFLGEVEGPAWIRAQLDSRGLPLIPAPAPATELAAAARRAGLDAMVIDSYETDPACGRELRRAGLTVLAIVDGDLRGQEADLYLDQNLGAEETATDLPRGAVRLAGAGYVLLRDSVRLLRPVRPRAATRGPARMLCVFGGTDTADAAPAVTRLAAETSAPFRATVVAARAGTVAALAALPLAPGQSVTPIPPTDRLPRLAAGADLAVSAAGSATWELMCLGVPAALIWVAGNQRLGYEATVSRGLTAGLGNPAEYGDPAVRTQAIATLRRLLLDPAERDALARRGHGLIDGRGRERVADALLGHPRR